MNDVVKDGLGVRIYRGNKVYGFWEPQTKKLEADDVIVEIIPGNGAFSDDKEEEAAS